MSPSTENKIKALKLARRLIASGEISHLCTALDRIADADGRLVTAAYELKRYISKMLGGAGSSSSTLGEWQRQHGVRPLDWIPSESRASKLQYKRDRLAWIDWMIRCLQEDAR